MRSKKLKICTDFESGQKENKVRNVYFIAIGGCAFYCNREAVQLANMDPDKIINTHMEFVAPAIQRMTHTNLLDNGRNRGPGQN